MKKSIAIKENDEEEKIKLFKSRILAIEKAHIRTS